MSAPLVTANGIDAGFLRRVYVASLAFALLGGAVATSLLTFKWGLGFAAAALWSTLNFRALEILLRLSVTPADRNPLQILVAGLIKLPILYGLGALLVLKGNFPPAALVSGFSVPLGVIVLKVAGQLLAPKVALSDRPSTFNGS